MAGEISLFTPRMSDAATLSGSATVAGMGVTQLQNPFPHEVWRSTSLSSVFVQADLGTLFGGGGLSVQWTVALLWNNARAATLWRIRTDDDSDPTTSPTSDSGSITMWPTSSIELGLRFPHGTHAFYQVTIANSSIRYIRIDFSDGTHPDGYFEGARLFIAARETTGTQEWLFTPLNTWRPSRGPAVGSGYTAPQEREDGERADGGVLYAYESERPQFTGPQKFIGLTKDEAARMTDLYRDRGTSGDVLFVREPSASGGQYMHEQMVHGYLRDFDSPTEPKLTAGRANHELSFEVEGIL